MLKAKPGFPPASENIGSIAKWRKLKWQRGRVGLDTKVQKCKIAKVQKHKSTKVQIHNTCLQQNIPTWSIAKWRKVDPWGGCRRKVGLNTTSFSHRAFLSEVFILKRKSLFPRMSQWNYSKVFICTLPVQSLRITKDYWLTGSGWEQHVRNATFDALFGKRYAALHKDHKDYKDRPAKYSWF